MENRPDQELGRLSGRGSWEGKKQRIQFTDQTQEFFGLMPARLPCEARVYKARGSETQDPKGKRKAISLSYPAGSFFVEKTT